MSSFSGLSSALSALHASQRAMEVTANNIANVNTEGYSRQRVALTEIADFAQSGIHSQGLNIGDGVQIEKIERIKDAFLETRGRIEHAQKAYRTGQQQTLTRVEQVFAEPGDTALQAQLTEFWGAFSDVANRPDDDATRTALMARGRIVTENMQDMANQLESVWDTTKAQLGTLVEEINEIASTVAGLNKLIITSRANQSSNDLADQRDLAVMRLTELAGATAVTRSDGSVDVMLGGSQLVGGDVARRLLAPSGAQTPADAKAGTLVDVRWADGANPKAAVTSGTLAASLEALNSTIPTYARRLDGVAVNLAATLNDAHVLGQTDAGVQGGPMFGPPPPAVLDATNIRMAITDASELAIADLGADVGAKDGTNADRMADLAKDPDGPDRLYRQLVVDLGVQGQSVKRQADIQAARAAQVDSDRIGQSGVNLDEEMSNLIQFERSYQAAAKVIATIDEMLDVLINRM